MRRGLPLCLNDSNGSPILNHQRRPVLRPMMNTQLKGHLYRLHPTEGASLWRPVRARQALSQTLYNLLKSSGRPRPSVSALGTFSLSLSSVRPSSLRVSRLQNDSPVLVIPCWPCSSAGRERERRRGREKAKSKRVKVLVVFFFRRSVSKTDLCAHPTPATALVRPNGEGMGSWGKLETSDGIHSKPRWKWLAGPGAFLHEHRPHSADELGCC